MRRHAPPHEAAPNAYYAAPMQPPRGYPAESGGGGGHKPKKGWGERLRLGRGDKGTPPTLLDEYRHKYGTLSSGSALSKSMKYAETWLYGSVSVRHGANGVLLCPPPVVPKCACAEFLAGTQRGKKAAAAVCKKCGGSRVVWGPPGGTVRGMGGTVRGMGGTLRLGGGGHARVRPSLISITPPAPHQQTPQKSITPDPYDLMRRNRLGSITTAEGPPQFNEPNGQFLSPSFGDRTRAKSTSPGRRGGRRSPSPPARLLRYSPDNRRRSSRRDLAWELDSLEQSPDTSKRKSILECDVNAYELIAKYLRNGGNPPPEEGPQNTVQGSYRPSFDSVTSDDDVLDDELSDDLSDNALENSTSNKSFNKNRVVPTTTTACPNHHKTDLKKGDTFTQRKLHQENTQKAPRNTPGHVSPSIKIPGVEKLTPTSGTRPLGVTTIGGQTIRVFSDSPPCYAKEEEEFVSDEEKGVVSEQSLARVGNISEEDDTTDQHVSPRNSSSHIPRPRRPPRKQKCGSTAAQVPVNRNDQQQNAIPEDEENESESIVTFKDDVYIIDAGESSLPHGGITRGERRSGGSLSSPSTADGSVIKSILKKPSLSPPAVETFGDTILKPDGGSSSGNSNIAADHPHSPSPATNPAAPGTADFYLPTFQEFKQQNRKKKQVQFKVIPQEDIQQQQQQQQTINQVEEAVQAGREDHQGVEEPTLIPLPPPADSDSYDTCSGGDITPQEEETSLPADVKCSPPKLQYFGDSQEDATVVNTASTAETTPSQPAPDTPTPAFKKLSFPRKDSVPATDAAKSGRSSVVTLRRSHSDRQASTSSGSSTGRDSQGRRHSNKQLFNDTMRLRLRTGARPDSRHLFDNAPAPTPKRPQRMLSPGRPRPKEPPPPPPPPAPTSPTTQPPAPPPLPLPELPKRQIFPFTKEQLEGINVHSRHPPKLDNPSEVHNQQNYPLASKSNRSHEQKTSPNNKPAKRPENNPSSDEKHTKSRPNSWSPSYLTSSSPDSNNLDTACEFGARKKEHRLSDPGPGPSKLRLHYQRQPHLEEQAAPKVDPPRAPAKNVEDEVLMRTIVTVSPVPPSPTPSDVHRLQISSDPLSYQIEVSPHPQRRTSILINGSDGSSISNNSSSRTSVIIEDTSRCSTPSRDDNKVTINVGGMSDLKSPDTTSTSFNSSSSRTVIDTSSTGSSNIYNNPSSFTVVNPTVTNVSTNQIVIPVSPDQKTRVFLDHRSSVEVSGETASGESKVMHRWSDTVNNTQDAKYTPSTVLFVDGDSDNYSSGSISNVVIGSRSSRSVVIGSSSGTDVEDTAAILLDPVEAVRRNLVPHVCGKKDSDSIYSSSSAVERLSSLINQPEDDVSETMKENDYYLTAAAAKLLDPPEDLKVLLRSDSMSTDHSENCDSVSDPSSSSCEQITAKNDDTASISDLALSRPHFVIVASEKDKQEAEVELRGSNEENLYESIKDPIYEEIPETPPPLPLSPPPSLDDVDEDKRGSRSIFEGASKYDILSYLEGAKERGIVPEESDYGGSANGDEVADAGKESLGDLSSRVSHLSNTSDSSEDSCNLIIASDGPDSQNKVRKSSAEIERNDSGVGSETSKSSRSRWQPVPAGSLREDQQLLCEDCDQRVETQVTDSGVMFAPLVCRKCGKKRAERKEIIAEIVETEEKYGRDLQIILDEFYRPMLVAGLLTPEQLAAIFLNVEELVENAGQLAERLRDTLEIAVEQGDEDLLTVNMGKLFLEAAPMLHAFESYCTRQGAASMLLANLEKEKELLRIFLRVSQMENAVLRRMNLNSFLMVPVQRVTKYPLLLARLYKVTPAHHEGREQLKQAQHKIELHLEHMNSEAKDVTTTKLWRRISIINVRRPSSETDMIIIKLRKMALDILEWNHDEVRFSMEGKLFYTNPTDNNWRRGKTVKLNPINALLVTKGKPMEDYPSEPPEEPLMFAKKNGIREATLLLVKEKCGRYSLLRDPLYLDKCIVCCDADWEDYFEVQELASKETYIFRGEDGERTKAWYRQLQYHAQGLGAWRRRRNALANIMINGMLTRS